MLAVYFVSPYFDHDAFMHHPMYVLDAPDGSHQNFLMTQKYVSLL